MGEQLQADPVDLAIARVAARQHGVVAYAQLKALGLSRQSIDHRVRTGRLHRIHRGVYAVGHRRLTQRGRWMAAVLAGGPGAVLSHRSAAALWQMLPPGPTHVTTPKARRNRDGIHFHSQPLPSDEVTTHDGIPVTTPARTLIDIAATEPRQLERAFNEAEYRRLDDQIGIDTILSRNPSRPGAPATRALLERGAHGRTREELEHRFRRLVAQHRLPEPEFNADFELQPGRWIQLDCLWRDARLVLELDGRGAHETSSRFDSDRERDRLLALQRILVVRATWRHVTTDAAQLAADLADLIVARR